MPQLPDIPGLVVLVLVGAYLTLAAASYALYSVFFSAYHDHDIERRGDSALLGMRARLIFSWAVQPIWQLVQRLGLPPEALTTLGVLLSVGSGVTASAGQFAAAGWLYLAAGLCDVLDGRLARAQGRASKSGAALDSVLDRYCDAAVLVGMAWYYRHSWVLIAVLASLVGSLLVSYVRARAEGLGVDARVGLMQRPERVVVLGVAMALSPIVDRLVTIAAPPFVLSVAAVCFVALTTHATALYRLHHLLRRLGSQSFGFGSHLIGVAISSALATAVDFGVMVTMVEFGHIVPWLATGIAALAGASVNFSINRLLVFESDDPAAPQAFRYSVVSATGALLNAGGVGAVLLQPDLDYRIGWLVVRAAVFLLWSYTLQRTYVYRPAVRNVATSDPAELVLRNVERAPD